jgi:class 3 adenylate cyclase
VHSRRVLAHQQRLLEAERARSEGLLRNLLPISIAERLKQRQEVIADASPKVTVLFADIADFTPHTERSSPEATVALLNDLFSQFEAVVGEVGERVASQLKAWVASSDPMAFRSAPNTVTGSWVDHIARRGPGSPLISACSASSWRVRVGVRKSSSSLMATLPSGLGLLVP